jgi:hypothetical protein
MGCGARQPSDRDGAPSTQGSFDLVCALATRGTEHAADGFAVMDMAEEPDKKRVFAPDVFASAQGRDGRK